MTPPPNETFADLVISAWAALPTFEPVVGEKWRKDQALVVREARAHGVGGDRAAPLVYRLGVLENVMRITSGSGALGALVVALDAARAHLTEAAELPVLTEGHRADLRELASAAEMLALLRSAQQRVAEVAGTPRFVEQASRAMEKLSEGPESLDQDQRRLLRVQIIVATALEVLDDAEQAATWARAARAEMIALAERRSLIVGLGPPGSTLPPNLRVSPAKAQPIAALTRARTDESVAIIQMVSMSPLRRLALAHVLVLSSLVACGSDGDDPAPSGGQGGSSQGAGGSSSATCIDDCKAIDVECKSTTDCEASCKTITPAELACAKAAHCDQAAYASCLQGGGGSSAAGGSSGAGGSGGASGASGSSSNACGYDAPCVPATNPGACTTGDAKKVYQCCKPAEPPAAGGCTKFAGFENESAATYCCTTDL